MSYKGKFVPQNISKYRGDFQNITFRSLWERQVMKYLDERPEVIEWSSEELIIPYLDPVKGHTRRYFPDFYIKVRYPDSREKCYIWEVKPSAQAREPKVLSEGIKTLSKPARRKYIKEVLTYSNNKAKWDAASRFCEDRGWVFQVVTEKELPFMAQSAPSRTARKSRS